MKRTLHSLAALVVAAAVLIPVQARAQAINFFVGGGGAFGMSDLKDGTDTGWLGFAGLDYPITSVPGLAIGATASYTHIPFSDADAATNIPALFGELSYLIGVATTSPVKPYIRGGVGVMQQRFDPGGGYNADSKSDTKAGVSGGAGLTWMMGSISPFIGAHIISGGSRTTFAAVYVGFSFGGGSSKSSARRVF